MKADLINKEETYAQSFIRYTKMELDDIKRSFIKIGFRLKEAVKYEYYKELGYPDIVELAEAEFGFKKSTTYELIKVYELAHDENCPMQIAKKYDKFSYSQLLALSYVKYDGTAFWEIPQPTDSVRALKQFVSNWNKEYKTGCGWHPGLKTVGDYLQHAEEQKENKHIREVESLLMISGGSDKNNDFSERSEKLGDKTSLISDNFTEVESVSLSNPLKKCGCKNIEYIRIAPIMEVAKMITECVCSLPDSFGDGMPYDERLSKWLQIWLLSD